MKQSIYLFLLSLLFIGCSAGSGSLANEANFKKIQLKMSPEEVTNLVGEPTKKQSHPQFRNLVIWDYSTTSHVTFDDKKVTAVSWDDKMLVEEELPDDDE